MKSMKERITERIEIGRQAGDVYDELIALAEQGWTKEQLRKRANELGFRGFFGSYVYHWNNFADKLVSFLDRIGV